MLSQAYLENEARDAADFMQYQPEVASTTGGGGVWTSTPAAPGAEGFKALDPPPFDIGAFSPAGPPTELVNQPSLSISPDIPSILTGEHPVIAIDQKLAAEESNGQTGTKVPALPAWYMTTHDVAEMNEVALRRAQESQSMPEGLDRLESELSYDALPVVDARFRQGVEPAASQEAPPPPAEQVHALLQPQSDPGASGSWATPTNIAAGTELTESKDYVDSIFEGSGARGSLETNPDAKNEETARRRRRRDKGTDAPWQPVEEGEGTAGSEASKPVMPGFVSPGSLAKPPAEVPATANLFERIGGQMQPAEEEPTARAWAEGERGHPTNLKDMLTADSAVFTTSDRGKLQDITPAIPMPEPTPYVAEPPAAEVPVAPTAEISGTPSAEVPAAEISSSPFAEPAAEISSSPFAEPAAEISSSPFAEPTAQPAVGIGTISATDTDAAPAPWMKLPHAIPAEPEPPQAEPPVAVEEAVTQEPAAPQTTGWDSFAQATSDAAAEPAAAETETAASGDIGAQKEDYNDLAVALHGLMDSPDAIEESKPEPALSAEETPASAFESAVPNSAAEPTFEPSAQALVEFPTAEAEPAATPEATDTASSEPDLFGDVMDKVIDHIVEAPTEPEADLDAHSMFEDNRDQTQDLNVALMQRLTSGPATLTGSPPLSSVADDSLIPSLSLPEPTESLVSPAMAAHAQSITEVETSAEEAPPAVTAEPEPPTVPEPSFGEASLTPLRPLRRRTVEASAPPSVPEVPSEAAAPEAVIPEPVVPEPVVPEALAPEVAPEAAPEPAPPSTFEAAPAVSNELPSAAAAAEPASAASTSDSLPSASTESSTPAPATTPAITDPMPSLTISQETEILEDLGESFEDSGVFLTEREPTRAVPYGQESKLTASGIQRAHQPTVEPKLVISESTRFMARLNQRLSEADKKLSSRCDQSRDRLMRELDALVEEAHKVERQNELSTGALTEQLMKHLETVSDEVKARIEKTSAESRSELTELIKLAENAVSKMHADLRKELDTTESTFQADSEALAETTRGNLNQHAQERINDFNKKLEEISNALEAVYKHHIKVLMTRFDKFQTRLNEEVDAIISALDRNVGSMTVEIDGSWDRASEKLMASQTEFGNSVNYLVHSCRAELKQVHLDSYARKVLPRLLENKDIFRAMLLDMKRNFEEQSEKVRKQQLLGLVKSISTAKSDLDALTKECLNTIESVGKGQQFGLEELFNSTSSRLEEIISTVETRLKTAKQEITDNDEACTKTSEASRVEDEPAFSKEKQQAIAALNESRTKADNALETHISSSCLDLEQLSEEMQEDLAKQRQDWTAQVRVTADESISKVKQAIQDAFQAIDSAKDKYME